MLLCFLLSLTANVMMRMCWWVHHPLRSSCVLFVFLIFDDKKGWSVCAKRRGKTRGDEVEAPQINSKRKAQKAKNKCVDTIWIKTQICGCKFVATNLNHKNANWGFCVDTLMGVIGITAIHLLVLGGSLGQVSKE